MHHVDRAVRHTLAGAGLGRCAVTRRVPADTPTAHRFDT